LERNAGPDQAGKRVVRFLPAPSITPKVVEACAARGIPRNDGEAALAQAWRQGARHGKPRNQKERASMCWWNYENHLVSKQPGRHGRWRAARKSIGEIRKDGGARRPSRPLKKSVSSRRFFNWLTDPVLDGRRRPVRFRMLWSGPDDLADGPASAPLSVTAGLTQQIKPQIYPKVGRRRRPSSWTYPAAPKASSRPPGTGRSDRKGSRSLRPDRPRPDHRRGPHPACASRVRRNEEVARPSARILAYDDPLVVFHCGSCAAVSETLRPVIARRHVRSDGKFWTPPAASCLRLGR